MPRFFCYCFMMWYYNIISPENHKTILRNTFNFIVILFCFLSVLFVLAHSCIQAHLELIKPENKCILKFLQLSALLRSHISRNNLLFFVDLSLTIPLFPNTAQNCCAITSPHHHGLYHPCGRCSEHLFLWNSARE